MNPLKSIINLVALVFLFNGCGEKRFEAIDVPSADANKLVLYASFEASNLSGSYVFLTRTNQIGKVIKWDFNIFSILIRDTSGKGKSYTSQGSGIYFDTVVGASIKLYRNDTLLTEVQKSPTGPDGVFRIGKADAMKADDVYKIVASAPNFTTIESSQKVPQSIKPNRVFYSGREFKGEYSNTFKELVIEFDDPPNVENYYEIAVTRLDSSYLESSVSAKQVDPNSIGFTLLSDKNFNGKKYQWKIGVDALSADSTYYRGLYVYFVAANRDYEAFTKTNRLLSEAQSNPFIEPFQPFSNVKNGYGFFMVFGQQSRTFLKN